MHGNQVIEAKMTVHLGFVNLSMTVTTDDISSELTEAKITVQYRTFLNLCMAVTTGDNVSS